MDMRAIITKLNEVLNLIKGFTAGYGSDTFRDGYMLLTYEGKRYAVKITEIENPSENTFDDIRNLKYLV